MPPDPAMTNCDPAQVIEVKKDVVPEVRLVQEMPSVEVRIVPEAPTETN